MNPNDPVASSRRNFLDMAMRTFGGAAAAAAALNGDNGAHLLRAAEMARLPGSHAIGSNAPGPHFPGKAKHVIYLHMVGGPSQIDLYDYKPKMNAMYDKDLPDSVRQGQRLTGMTSGQARFPIAPSKYKFAQHGKSGMWVSELLPNTAKMVDEMCFIRSMNTDAINHEPAITFAQTGNQVAGRPCLGSWTSYGLGTLNQNLPEYVVLGEPTGDCCGGSWTHGAAYLGPEYAGVRIDVAGKEPLPFVTPAGGMKADTQLAELGLLGKLNTLAGIDYPNDPAIRARIKSYELAYGMQTALPETLKIENEGASTYSLYGFDRDETRSFAQLCLVARRLVERGVRFVQIFHGGGGGGAWDAHAGIKANHGQLSAQVDRPIAGLIRDLKRRGMLDETLVVCGTEFGRSPGAQADGRDHHPQGFCAWLAGGGIKGGVVHGATDELGFHAVEDRHYVTDIHATVLHQLGLDSRKLEIPGRKRLEIDHGRPIAAILA